MAKVAKKKKNTKKVTLDDINHAIDKLICENDLFTDEDIAEAFSQKLQFNMHVLNRSIVIIKPKQPFVDWVNSTNPDPNYVSTLEMLRFLPKCFLIPKWDGEYLKKNYDKIWQWKLFGYGRDERTYPKKRTYKKFQEWFDVEIGLDVFDFVDKELIRKELVF